MQYSFVLEDRDGLLYRTIASNFSEAERKTIEEHSLNGDAIVTMRRYHLQ